MGEWGTALPKNLLCPLLQEEPDIPFTEEDYRRRRCHPNFKDHIALEKLVIKLGKTVSVKSPVVTDP